MNFTSLRSESGLGLVEILIAVGIITVGLVAVMQAFPVGIQGVDIGRRQSTAVFLAQQKLDQVKAWSMSTATAPVLQGFPTLIAGGTCFTYAGTVGPPPVLPGACRNDAFNTIPGFPNYQRLVQINNGPTASTRVAVVQVTYRNATGQDQVNMSTLLASH